VTSSTINKSINSFQGRLRLSHCSPPTIPTHANVTATCTYRRFRIYRSVSEITSDGVFLRKMPIHYGYSGLHRIQKRQSSSRNGVDRSHSRPQSQRFTQLSAKAGVPSAPVVGALGWKAGVPSAPVVGALGWKAGVPSAPVVGELGWKSRGPQRARCWRVGVEKPGSPARPLLARWDGKKAPLNQL
jgi:hypothetical protein